MQNLAETEFGPIKVSKKTYFVFQLAFWLVILLPDFLLLPQRQSIMDAMWAFGSVVMMAVATHIVHHVAQRRGWLRLPAREMIGRMAIVVLALAGIYFAAAFPEKLYQGPEMRRFFREPGILVGYWLGSLMMACAWLGCYLALYEGQRRRGLEFEQLRSRLAAREAQLAHLRAQINPHFLFNSLNSLHELVLENPGLSQRVISKLSVLLRYSLYSKGSEFTCLSDELEAIDGYLSVEAVRFQDRLRVVWDIEEEIRNAEIPRMLLQPLVENALKHGIARSPDGGEVIIRGKADSDRLHLDVLNTGVLDTSGAGCGVGLQNIRERLQLLYGAHATLSLTENREGQVHAAVVLPFNNTTFEHTMMPNDGVAAR